MEGFKVYCIERPFRTVFLMCALPVLGLILSAPYIGGLPRLVIGGLIVWGVSRVLTSSFGDALLKSGHAIFGPGAKNFGPRVFMWVVVALALAVMAFAFNSVLSLKAKVERQMEQSSSGEKQMTGGSIHARQ